MHSKFYEVRLIQLGKAKLAFYNVYFHRGWKLKCVPNFSWCKKKNEFKILKIIQGLSLEAKLIRTLVLVEISLGKEPDLAGFEGKLWQLIDSCWQQMKFFWPLGWAVLFISFFDLKFYNYRLIRSVFNLMCKLCSYRATYLFLFLFLLLQVILQPNPGQA